MAKGIGLIGNFKGKVGNMVGYKLSDSNTGNTQGIRVYQPIVRNPKTSAQAEQRAKLAPINATYRALKMIIDRGNEGLPYGNKSRLAWLKQAFKAESMPWIIKGAPVNAAVICQLTKGSLMSIPYENAQDDIAIQATGVTTSTPLNTVGALSIALLSAFPQLKEGDQLTFVAMAFGSNALDTRVFSVVINSNSTEETTKFSAAADVIHVNMNGGCDVCAVIVSREGANGEHLRSTESLAPASGIETSAPYDATSKAAAIESYMSSASANSDWAEESIQ